MTVIYTPPSSGGAEPAVTVGSEQQASIYTAELDPDEYEVNAVALGPAAVIKRTMVSVPARCRVYVSAAHRDADLARPIGTDPVGDHGLVWEYVETEVGGANVFCNPPAIAFNGDLVTPSNDLYCVTQNLDVAPRAVNVVITYVALSEWYE